MKRRTEFVVLSFWFPLALSWIMMGVAIPIVSAGIARLPDPDAALAAFGVAKDLALLIESPIIMILSTSVALARNWRAYRIVRRFTVRLSWALTGLGLVVFFTPVYRVVFISVLAIPSNVAAEALPALRMLLLWPAVIAWRRLLQGILIQHGKTGLVTVATVARLATLVVTMAIGVGLHNVPGATLGSIALILSVTVEAAVVSWSARPLLKTLRTEQVLSSEREPIPLTDGSLIRFYLPLSVTDVMRVASRPLVLIGITRAVSPELSLAAWPVAYGLTTLLASPAMAFQEVVVALSANTPFERASRAFIVRMGIVLSVLMMAVAFTPMGHVYFSIVIGVGDELERLAIDGTRLMSLMPLVFAVRNMFRGQLITMHQTTTVQMAMMVNLVSLVILLSLGLGYTRLSGVLLGSAAMTLSHIAEVAVLYFRSNALSSVAVHSSSLKGGRETTLPSHRTKS